MDVDMENKNRTFPMDVSSAGVDKLRLTVKDKLKEFMDSYTDDVLAEYVVVLVGHGKQKRQTSADLEAFLGDQSEAFVTWLWDHLSQYKDVYMSATQSTNIKDKDMNERESLHPDQKANVASGRVEQGEAVSSDADELPRLIQKESKRLKKDLLNHVSSSDPKQTSSSHGRDHGKHENGRKRRTYDGRVEVKRWNSPDSKDERARGQRERDRSPDKITHRKESSRYHVRAPRRLLESAVREAVAPAVSMLRKESSRKKLRSVVSAEEEHSDVPAAPNESGHAPSSQVVLSKHDSNALPSAVSSALNATKATAEDVDSFEQIKKISVNSVWDRLGNPANKGQPLHDEVLLGVFVKEELSHGISLDEKNYYGAEDLLDIEIEDPFVNSTSNKEQAVTLEKKFTTANIKPMMFEAARTLPSKGCSTVSIHHGEKLGSYSIQKDMKGGKLSGGSKIEKVGQVLNMSTHTLPVDKSQQRECGHKLSVEPRLPLCSAKSEAEDRHEKDHEMPVSTSAQKAVDNVLMKGPTDNGKDSGVQKDVLTKAQSDESMRELDVNEMKRRMRQVELEMTKLRARQAEVCKDVQESSTPISGLKTPGKSQSSEIDNDEHSIFVTNVHFSATKDAISAHFASCGDISRVTVLTDGTTGKSKGSAIVEFASKEGMEKALNLNESNFFSRILKVVRKDSSCLESSSSTLTHQSQAPLQPAGRGGIIPRLPPPLRWPVRPFRPFPSTHHFQWKRESSLPGANNNPQAATHVDSALNRQACPTSPSPPSNAFRYGVNPLRLKRSLSYVRNAHASTPSEASKDKQEQKVG